MTEAAPPDAPDGPGAVRVRSALISVQVRFGINYLTSKHVVSVLDPAA